MSFYKKIPIHGGGYKSFTVLCSLENWQTAHYLFTCTGYDEEGCGFQFRSPGKLSYNQSKHYGLACWNSIPGFPGILHPPSCMDRSWI